MMQQLLRSSSCTASHSLGGLMHEQCCYSISRIWSRLPIIINMSNAATHATVHRGSGQNFQYL
ncbi:unnamed protein product [Rhodiola kirilowii]